MIDDGTERAILAKSISQTRQSRDLDLTLDLPLDLNESPDPLHVQGKDGLAEASGRIPAVPSFRYMERSDLLQRLRASIPCLMSCDLPSVARIYSDPLAIRPSSG